LEYREAGIDLKQQAVLFRAGHHSDQLEVELRAATSRSSNTVASSSLRRRTSRT
jgi:hypothetical protein